MLIVEEVARGVCGNSVLSTQVCCEPEATLKKMKSTEEKKEGKERGLRPRESPTKTKGDQTAGTLT